jgi:hypothetical protein
MLAVAIGYFALSTPIETQWVQIVLYVIATIFLITAVSGLCPLYSIFKINTCDLKE